MRKVLTLNFEDTQLLKNALVVSVLDEYKCIPEEATITYQFSDRFQGWVSKLIKKSNTSVWHYVNSPLKKAIIIAIILSLLTVTAMAVPAIREALVKFFVEEREPGVYGITFDPEQAATAPHQIEVYYGPSFVPEGFNIIIEEYATSAVALWWMNENGELICFDQDFIPQNANYSGWIGIDAEGTERESKIVYEYLVEIFYMEETYSVFWTDNQYIYSTVLSNTIPFDVFEQMLASMTELGRPE